MAELRFRVKADLVIGGKICPPSEVKLAEALTLEEPRPQVKAGDITGFYLAAWPGGGSQEFSLSPIQPNGVADVSLNLQRGDPDAVVFAVVFGLATPKCVRCCHLASTFVRRPDLASFLSDPRRPSMGFTADQACVVASDNFTRNKAILRFLDAGTDLEAYGSAPLRESALARLDEATEAVKRLGAAVERRVASCAISPLNAGCQFVQSFTFGHLGGLLTHYALLGYLFDSMNSCASLPLALYNACQAMHSTNLSFEALGSMSDAEFVARYGLAVVYRHTSCALSNVYCPDVTVSVTGATCKVSETEDIAKSFSRLNFEVQNAGKLRPYSAKLELAPTLEEAVRAVAESQSRAAKLGNAFGAARISQHCLGDDCENTAQFMMQRARELRELYRAHSGGGARLARAVEEAAKAAPALFGNLAGDDCSRLAEVLGRLGRLLDDGTWSLALAVASAKGPSYSESSPQPGSGLCGHGACIARVYDAEAKLFDHYPVEGTTYLAVDRPLPSGYPSQLPLKLASGAVQSFPLETVSTLLAQNLHEQIGLSAHAACQAHLRQSYGHDALSCPFYVSTFFTSLSEGDRGSLGCIPLDSRPAPAFRAEGKLLFGAPVMGLSDQATMAMPVTASLLAGDTGKDPEALAQLLRDQVNEAYGPSVTQEMALGYLSYLQPVEKLDSLLLGKENYATALRSENTWAFDDPQVARKAVQVYQAVAQKFNELQAADPRSDGARATAFGQYLSACLSVCLPVPEDTSKFELSTIRNMKLASEKSGLAQAVASCVMKHKLIKARAAVASDHHIYMCDKGEGPVHAHRVKLV